MQKALEQLVWLSKVKRRNFSRYMVLLSLLFKLPLLLLGVLLCETSASEQQENCCFCSAERHVCGLYTATLCIPSTSVWKLENLANIRGYICFMINSIAHKSHLPIECLTFMGVFQLHDCSYGKQGKSWHKWSVLQNLDDLSPILVCLQELSLSSCHCHHFWCCLLTSCGCCKTGLETQERLGWSTGLRLAALCVWGRVCEIFLKWCLENCVQEGGLLFCSRHFSGFDLLSL